MNKRIVVIGLVVFLALPARTASACHTGEGIGRALFALMTIGIDIPLTVHDLVVDDSSKPYAIAEIVVAGGLGAGSIAFAVPRTCDENGRDYPTATSRERWFMAGLAVWNVALVAHGVWDLAKPRRSPQTMTLVPLTVGDESVSGLGLALAGHF